MVNNKSTIVIYPHHHHQRLCVSVIRAPNQSSWLMRHGPDQKQWIHLYLQRDQCQREMHQFQLKHGSEESPSSDRELCESFAFFVALACCRCLLLLLVRGMNSSGYNGLWINGRNS